MPENKKSNANPRITKMEIGIREVREVKIYPLSVVDELEMIATIKSVFAKLTGEKGSSHVVDIPRQKKRKSPPKKKEPSGFDFLEIISNELKSNFENIIELITDPDEKVSPKEFDNDYLSDLAWIIYDKNFRDSSKKLKDLFKEIAPTMEENVNGSQLKRSLQKFSETMGDTDTNTSSDSHTEREESPEDS